MMPVDRGHYNIDLDTLPSSISTKSHFVEMDEGNVVECRML